MKNAPLTFYLFFFILKTTFGQITLHGTVTDTNALGIPFANLSIKWTDTAPIIAFGTTDAKGTFNFTFKAPPQNQFTVTVSAFGYETQSVFIDALHKDTLINHFKLSPKAFELKETIILSNRKIILKSDTITFKADAFRDSTERTLEELLAKLPGIEVDKNSGAITVQGEPIKKILIEGDDLTGKNYQLMSKNLSADVIDKIQVIDKFTENKLLKRLKRSDDKVINITLKADKKKMLFGNASLGMGTDTRANHSLNLLGFYKKLKTITFANFNTIGQISTADRMFGMDFKEDTESENQQSLLKSRNLNWLDVGRTPSIAFNNQSVRFNQVGFVSTHLVMRPIESVILKGTLTASKDRVNTFVNNQFQYLLGNTSVNLVEQSQIQKKPALLEGHFEAQLDLGSKSLLRYKSDFRNTVVDHTMRMVSNGNGLSNQLKTNTLSFSNTLDFTYRMNENQAITSNITVVSDQNSQNLMVAQTIPRLLPFDVALSDVQFQNINKGVFYYATSGQWLFSNNTLKIASYVGSVFRKEDLVTQLQGQLHQMPFLFSDTFQNNLLYHQSNHYVGFNFKEEWHGVQWFSDISGGYYTMGLSERLNEAGFYALPTLGFKYKTNDKTSFFGTYAYNYALPQTHDLTTGYILEDYRSLDRGKTVLIPAHSHTSVLNYTYGNFADEFLGHFKLLHTTNTSGYRSSLGVNAFWNVSDKVENTFRNRNTMLSAALERYIPKLYVRLKVRPAISLGNYPNNLNGSAIRNTNTTNHSMDISLRSAYLRWFNFHLGSNLNQTLIRTEIGDTQTKVKNRSIGLFLDLYFKWNNRILGKIENEVFYFKQQNFEVQKYYFVNASFRFELVKTRLTAHLTAKNLLNTQEFVNSFVSDYVTQTNRIKLLPRYVLLELNFRF
jgi:CarboxypepD_reg-like domain